MILVTSRKSTSSCVPPGEVINQWAGEFSLLNEVPRFSQPLNRLRQALFGKRLKKLVNRIRGVLQSRSLRFGRAINKLLRQVHLANDKIVRVLSFNVI